MRERLALFWNVNTSVKLKQSSSLWKKAGSRELQSWDVKEVLDKVLKLGETDASEVSESIKMSKVDKAWEDIVK